MDHTTTTTTTELTPGTPVTYGGSMEDFHGEYVVVGRCSCRAECLDNTFAPERYALAEYPGWEPLLVHVRRQSITPA